MKRIRFAVLPVLVLLLGAGCLHAAAEASDETCNKELAKSAVHTAASGLSGFLADIKEEQRRIEVIRAFIAPVRFYQDCTGYFYVYNFDCINIAHATQKDLPGKNLIDHKDTKGKFVIRELSAAAKKGGGFVDFYWLKPGVRGEQKKIGHVEPIPGTPYFKCCVPGGHPRRIFIYASGGRPHAPCI